MNQPNQTRPLQVRACAIAALLCFSAAAQANVRAPAGDGVADYGVGGNVFQLEPLLFVQGLGNADAPGNVVALNPLLQYSSTQSGMGTSLWTLDYRVHNTSPIESFSDLRFMVYVNPDGDTGSFLDVISETWGAAAAGDPTRREVREFDFDPFASIPARFRVNNNLDEGPPALDAVCVASSGCDATLGLQWQAANLGPGEVLRIQVGLSDAQQSLSSRWIDVTAVNSPDTQLRVSGMSSVALIPEPATGWMLAGGLALLGAWARRRRAR